MEIWRKNICKHLIGKWSHQDWSTFLASSHQHLEATSLSLIISKGWLKTPWFTWYGLYDFQVNFPFCGPKVLSDNKSMWTQLTKNCHQSCQCHHNPPRPHQRIKNWHKIWNSLEWNVKQKPQDPSWRKRGNPIKKDLDDNVHCEECDDNDEEDGLVWLYSRL